MKAITNTLFILICILFLFSCEKRGREDDAELKYRYFKLENKGWKSKQHLQKVDDINFIATEVPLPYYILKEAGIQNLSFADSVYKKNNHERIIEFEFRQDEEKDLLKSEFTGLTYTDAIKYMSFAIEKDFYVVTNKMDTIKCSGITFERNFKVGPFQRVLLFFTDIKPEEDIQLVYNDHLFKKGVLKFTFKENPTKLIL